MHWSYSVQCHCLFFRHSLVNLIPAYLACSNWFTVCKYCILSASMISAGSAWNPGRSTVLLLVATSVATAMKLYARWKSSRICWRPRWTDSVWLCCSVQWVNFWVSGKHQFDSDFARHLMLRSWCIICQWSFSVHMNSSRLLNGDETPLKDVIFLDRIMHILLLVEEIAQLLFCSYFEQVSFHMLEFLVAPLARCEARLK